MVTRQHTGRSVAPQRERRAHYALVLILTSALVRPARTDRDQYRHLRPVSSNFTDELFAGATLDAPVPDASHSVRLQRHDTTNVTEETRDAARRLREAYHARRRRSDTKFRRRLASSDELLSPDVPPLMSSRSLEAPDAGVAPLFMGIGTHYAHVYVGDPPQRVSVIVDTGSHHTAFPCSGCKSCGHHTDPYFDPTKSKTLKWLQCHECVASARCVAHKCQVSQSYTEGSSWKAYQMRDSYYVGGETVDASPVRRRTSSQKTTTEEMSQESNNVLSSGDSSWLTTSFVFGCQTYETGLFRTQKADGIMGMSMHSQTLVPTMRQNGKIDHNVFALCFKYGGGTMSLGGVDRRSHFEPMRFTPLAKNSGWFTVRLVDVLMDGVSIDVPAAVYATGKGTIVDSGTTDTYLPRRAADKFKKAWADVVGPSSPKYANAKLSYAPQAIRKFPTLTFVFENDVRVDVKPHAYIEQAGGKYIPRVYLTEASGTVLGANFMQDHDIFFDAENRRVGFAPADCAYSASASSSAVAPGGPSSSSSSSEALSGLESGLVGPPSSSGTDAGVPEGIAADVRLVTGVGDAMTTTNLRGDTAPPLRVDDSTGTVLGESLVLPSAGAAASSAAADGDNNQDADAPTS